MLLHTDGYAYQNFAGHGPIIELRGKELSLLKRAIAGCERASWRMVRKDCNFAFINNAADKDAPLLSRKLDPGHCGGHFLFGELGRQQAYAGLKLEASLMREF